MERSVCCAVVSQEAGLPSFIPHGLLLSLGKSTDISLYHNGF